MAKYLTAHDYEGNVIERSTFFSSNNSEHLLIVFSSFDNFRLETGTFDFVGLCKETQVDILLVRDLNNSWFFFPGQYFDGGKGHHALLGYITDLSSTYENVSCIGSSMGGFGALYFGEKISNAKIFALSPQINIKTEFFIEVEDLRRSNITKLVNDSVWQDGLLEISKNSDVWSRSVLLYGQNDKMDVILHSRLRDVAPYSNILLPYVNHGLVHALRGSGLLRSFFSAIISGDSIPDFERSINSFHNDTSYVMDVIGPILLIDGNTLSYRLRLKLHHPNFWVDKKCKIVINAINDEINEKHKMKEISFYALEEQDLLIENDLSDLKNGFYSCEISVTINEISTIDIGHKNIYIQVQKENICCPVSIIKTGDDIARTLRKASMFA